MKTTKPAALSQALRALRQAIFEGATWRYEQLVTTALQAGASDEQVDLVAQEAIELLFATAERPITQRDLCQNHSVVRFRP